MSASAKQMREQESGEPHVLPSPLVELTRDEKGNKRPGSLSPLEMLLFKLGQFGKEARFA